MRLIPHSFNNFLFQQAPYVASEFDVKYDWSIKGLSTETIVRSNNFPLFTSKNYTGSIKVVTVNITNIDINRDALVLALDILGEGQKQLIALDEFGRQWYLNAVCLGVNEEAVNDNTASFGVTFETDDPVWKTVVQRAQTISVNVTGNGTITPIGNEYALPVITITPTASGGSGFTYKRFLQIINNSLNALNNYPVCLTGAGLDTSAIIKDNLNKCLVNMVGGVLIGSTTITYDTVTGAIPASGLIYIDTEQISYTSRSGTQFLGCVRGVNGTAAATHLDNAPIYTSKMSANGNDLRIYVDGVEVKRWLDGINTATTKVWVNVTQPANSNMTLGATIASTGTVSSITIENTAANVALMPLIPTSGFVLIGTEIFVYTGVNVSGLTLTGCVRAERQTSAGAHAIADVIKFITHDVWMYYGSPNISAYVVDDTYKPIINLNTSTNSSFVYAEFGNNAGLRTGAWTKLEPNRYDYYTGSQRALNTNPWEVIGVMAPTGFGLYNPCGITTVTATGYKMWTTSGSSTFWQTITLEKSLDGITYSNAWTESAPARSSFPYTWYALDAHAAVALGATYPYIKLKHDNGAEGWPFCHCEFDDATIALDAAKVPTITLAAEITSFILNSTLINAATGYSMTITLSMALNTTLTVNTKDKTITLFDGTNQINSLQNMPIRLNWFPLLPSQANVITITDAGQVTFAFTWEDRLL